MGEVYKARDTRLQRHVAIKILPGAFARDADRVARFEREAHVLASLNHPHIAQIYGVEESGGVLALVMELVDGRTLAEMPWALPGSRSMRRSTSRGRLPKHSKPPTSRALSIATSSRPT